VVEVYDYGETVLDRDQVPYIVMELVEGRSLTALLSAGPLPWRLAMLIGAQVAAALAAAHDRGVVHRDVKPANVMVTADGVKLVDFGISAAVGDGDPDSGEIIGTPAYLAPERLVNGVVRPATDVYALGLLLYMMLAGRLPWNASTTTQMLIAHRYRDPDPVPAVPDLPGDVVEMIQQCLAKAPAGRPPAVAAARILRRAAGLPPTMLLTTLTGAPSGTTDVATEPITVTAPTKIPAWPTRRRALAGGALLVAVAAAAVLWWPEGAAAPGPQPAAASPLTCEVSYTMNVVSHGKSRTAVRVTNTASTPIRQWTLSFRLPGGQRLVRGADTSWRQSGDMIEAKGRTLAPGAAASTWFNAAYGEVATLPQSFALNDVACGAELSVQGPRTGRASTTPKRQATKAGATRAKTPPGKAAAPKPAAPAARAKHPAPAKPAGGHPAAARGPAA
jgi:serine/threonine-protein kinase